MSGWVSIIIVSICTLLIMFVSLIHNGITIERSSDDSELVNYACIVRIWLWTLLGAAFVAMIICTVFTIKFSVDSKKEYDFFMDNKIFVEQMIETDENNKNVPAVQEKIKEINGWVDKVKEDLYENATFSKYYNYVVEDTIQNIEYIVV